LCPAMLTCVLGKRLCLSFAENHWALREDAAKVLADLCARRVALAEARQQAD
jgi:hypothetical protein